MDNFVTPVDSDTVLECCRCHGKETAKSGFIATPSSIYSLNGYLPVCNKCISEIYDQFVIEYEDPQKAIQRVCMAFNLYYDGKRFDSCVTKSAHETTKYFKRLRLRQNVDRTYETFLNEIGFAGFGTTEDDNLYINNNIEDTDDEDDVITISKASRERWGRGLENPEDYKILDDHYKYLNNANPNLEANQRIFVLDLCRLNLQKIRALEKGDNKEYMQLVKSYQDLFAKAGLRLDTSEDKQVVLGKSLAMISQYTPEEYYRDKQRYKDFDGIGELFQRFLLRPLKNLVLGTEERDPEFNVEKKDAGD